MKSIFKAAVLFIMVSLSFQATAVPPTYVLTDLGTLQTLPTCIPPEVPTVTDPTCALLAESSGESVNSNGQVVGSSDTGGIYDSSGFPQIDAFLHNGTSMQDLGVLFGGDTQSVALSVNDYGQIVGFSETDTGDRNAFIYDPGVSSSMQTIVTDPTNVPDSYAYDINNNGQVVGFSSFNDTIPCYGDPYKAERAFLYDPSVSPDPSYIAALPGAIHDYAQAINQGGHIAGYSIVPAVDPVTGDPLVDTDGCPLSYSSRATIYDTALTALGVLPGATWSEAYDINTADEVVGRSGVVDPVLAYHAFRYTDADGMMTDLGVMPGGLTSEAYGVNDYGEIVGFGDTSASSSHAFVYNSATSTMYDLNDLVSAPGWELTKAWAINNRGQITGDATYTYDDPVLGTVTVGRAFLLTPPDTDGDGVADTVDNCTLVANPGVPQRDTDGDGFGNICDPDVDNNGTTNIDDLTHMLGLLNSSDPDSDLDGNGTVNIDDLLIALSRLNQPPGPSAITP